MKVIRARIRGLGDTIESRWFELSPRLNLFHFPGEQGCSSFLQTLATINPLLPCESTRPFADFPLIDKRHGYSKKIYPEKRTVALAIFNTSPDVVADLAAISPHLYEADRIEVGRRLDYSRWINFVEIASSTRWREIAADLQQLAAWTRELAPEKAKRFHSLTASLQGSDRIKDGIDRDLAEWLQSLPPEIFKNSKWRIDNLGKAIRRAEDFGAARRIVRQRLPIFAVMNGSSSADPTQIAPLLHRINDMTRELGGPSAAASRDFLEELNRHLADAQFAGLRLHLKIPGPGGAEVDLSAKPALQDSASPTSSLLRLQAAAALTIAFSRVTCRTEPVLLFDRPERHVPGALHRQLREFILTAAEFCQCCYGFATDIFSRHRGLTRHTASDLTRSGR